MSCGSSTNKNYENIEKLIFFCNLHQLHCFLTSFQRMTSTPSPGHPNSPMQSEKSKRYDRQLRLWGDHGQVPHDNWTYLRDPGFYTGSDRTVLRVMIDTGNCLRIQS
jgi:hypothetical protein